MEQLTHYIGGEWRPSRDTAVLESRNPADGAVLATFPRGCAEDTDAAIAASREAFTSWSGLEHAERLTALRAFIDRVETQVPELARWEHLEMGKPEPMASGMILGAIAAFRAALDEAENFTLMEEIDSPTGTTIITRNPRGVIAQIVPWNFTIAQVIGALAPLLAVGNCVIVKPSEKSTPSAVELFRSNTLPSGVLNLLLGDGVSGSTLSGHPGIDGVIFTGSVATGRKVAAAATANLNPVTLELGGKDAAIVDADVDLEAVVRDVAFASFLNSGQICTSIERLYVHEHIAEKFLALFLEEARKYESGGEMQIGPMVDANQREIVHTHVTDAVTKGASLLLGGELPRGSGAYYPVTVLSGVDDSMLLGSTETFGPVVGVSIVPDFEEALRRAAHSDYGLAATVYTQSADHIRAAATLPVGYVWVNGWQGTAGIRLAEPHGVSGLGAAGNQASFDNAVRTRTTFVPKGNSN